MAKNATKKVAPSLNKLVDLEASESDRNHFVDRAKLSPDAIINLEK
jgi:hypothetical protein